MIKLWGGPRLHHFIILNLEGKLEIHWHIFEGRICTFLRKSIFFMFLINPNMV